MKTRQTETMSRAQLLFLFLRGSKRYYLLAILGSLFVTLTEMVTPQIIKITVDSVIGDAPLDAPFFLESVIAYTRQDQVSPTQISQALTAGMQQPGFPSSLPKTHLLAGCTP